MYTQRVTYSHTLLRHSDDVKLQVSSCSIYFYISSVYKVGSTCCHVLMYVYVYY